MTREEQENRKLENQLKRIEETVLLCTKFLLTNASDIELSNMTLISSSTVGRRLTNKGNVIQAYDAVKKNLLEASWSEEEIPKDGIELFELIAKKRQENLLRGKSLGGQTTLLNHVYNKGADGKFEGSTKIELSVIYKEIENQYKFMVHAALTFRLHLDTLSNLLQIDENELLENMIRLVPNSYNAITYLLYHDVNEQTIARQEFLSYYRELLNAIRTKDIEEKKRLISIVTDFNVAQIRKKHQLGDPLSEQEIEAILKYQIKYALTQEEISLMFDINRANYSKRVEKIIQKNLGLKTKYEYLSDYNVYRFKEGRRRG